MYNILIAEPDQTSKVVLSRIIRHFYNDASLYCVSTDEEIIDTGRKEKIDILFLSISTKSLSRIEAGKSLRKINPNLFICLMSVFDISYYGKELFALRADKFLTRPFSDKEVTATLREFKQQSDYVLTPATKDLVTGIKIKDFPLVYRRLMPTVMEFVSGSKDELQLRYNFIQLAEYIKTSFLGINHNLSDIETISLNIQWCEEEELLKIWLYNIVDSIFQKVSLDNYRILIRFFEFIEENKYEHFSLGDIVSGCNISQGYLSRIFRKEFNMSVMDYVKLKKIQLVKLNLIFSDYSLSELAARIGFYDGGHMHRLFQQYEKISIQEFKKKIAKLTKVRP